MKTAPTLQALFYSIFSLLFLFTNSVVGQINGDEEDEFFLGGISPVVLDKDATEINFVNSLNSFWIAYYEFIPSTVSTRIADRKRFTRFDQLLRVSHGFTNSGRWDLGADFRFVHTRLDEEAKSSPFKVFQGTSATGRTDQALAYIGLRTRFMPFESLPELTLQGTFNYPIARESEIRKRLSADRSQAGIQATFFQNLNPTTLYFLQGEWNVFFASDDHDQTTHLAAMNGYMVFSFMDKQIYIYPGLTYVGTYQKYAAGGSFNQVSQQVFGGLGVQWQTGSVLGISLFLQKPLILESGSQFSEFVRESYSSVTLGFRVLF